MLKEIYIQGNVKYLMKLYDVYQQIEDDIELLKIAGRLIQIDDDLIDKAYNIKIFDDVYKIVAKHRKQCREILELEGNLSMSNDIKKLEYVREYKEQHFKEVLSVIETLLHDISKAISDAKSHDKKELEAFLQINYADYLRYACEVCIDKDYKKELMQRCDEAYLKYFDLCEAANVCLVSTPYMTGHYNYSLFQFEVQEEKEKAIKYLNLQKSRFIDLLDTIFKNFTDSYDLVNLITDTLTNWILLVNSGSNNEEEHES